MPLPVALIPWVVPTVPISSAPLFVKNMEPTSLAATVPTRLPVFCKKIFPPSRSNSFAVRVPLVVVPPTVFPEVPCSVIRLLFAASATALLMVIAPP